MIRAVLTAVDAVVGEIQRSEHDDAVAVELLLDIAGELIDLLVFILQLTVEQDKRILMGDTLHLARFFKDAVDHLAVVFVFLCIGETAADFLIADEFLGLGRHDVVHTDSSFFLCVGQFGIDRFDRKTVEIAKTAGQSADHIVRCIDSNADE